mmetsp:Transcript_62551/g.70774  ORF Transcript_62551/g.70774 Transcript_62551/m.70774 type:complete len:85 (+) Transcript_62551:48-302(+)
MNDVQMMIENDNDNDNDLHLMKDIIEVDNKRFKKVIENDSDYTGDGDGDDEDDDDCLLSFVEVVILFFSLQFAIFSFKTSLKTD